ncbi:hypothetical protein GCM10010341_60620 [Streptomyces noursei]|nr:hypothetical protein GCM10010341_60620 [Streptomyces noursei]
MFVGLTAGTATAGAARARVPRARRLVVVTHGWSWSLTAGSGGTTEGAKPMGWLLTSVRSCPSCHGRRPTARERRRDPERSSDDWVRPCPREAAFPVCTGSRAGRRSAPARFLHDISSAAHQLFYQFKGTLLGTMSPSMSSKQMSSLAPR